MVRKSLSTDKVCFVIVLQWILFAYSVVAADTPQIPAPEGRPNYCGVWGIWGGERVSREGRPWFKGVVVTATWKGIERRPGEFDFSEFDSKIQRVVDNGLSAMVLIYHADQSPDWIYDHGVERVETDEPSPRRRIHPYFLDPDFKPLLSRLIHATAEHVAAYPPEVRGKIVGVQCPTGKSGDPQPYNGKPLDAKYRINLHDDAWVDWTLGMFPVYREAYAQRNLDVFLLFKGPNPQSNDWLMRQMPDSWRKPHAIAQGYQFNNEIRVMSELYPRTRRRIDGVLIRTRGELDHTADKGRNWFNAAPVWNVYWAGLWNLTYGIDIWNQLTSALEDDRFVPAFEFVSRYAGYKTAAESPGAWIALRDGLDCADRERFREDRFGKLEDLGPWGCSSNVERYQAIAGEFAEFGALNEDLTKIGVSDLKTRGALALNDVGFNIWTDNYGMFLTQIDPNGTSRGYWRVGSRDEPYGRFARGFEHATGRNAMHFRLDDGFFADTGEATPRRVRLRIVYFDRGTGQWALRYDAVADANKTAQTVRKSDSGRWKEILVDIADGRFAGRGEHGADISLVNVDDENDIFHMIEVIRAAQ
ncbi:MAG: hypothetical protein ACOY3P_24305 [Planctomycetota bacterium]